MWKTIERVWYGRKKRVVTEEDEGVGKGFRRGANPVGKGAEATCK